MRLSRIWQARQTGPQVLGTDVPSFEKFPYCAQDILHLYRDFCRLIQRYPPQERPDLLFRLRNEFRSKRHLSGPRVIAMALKRGQGVLDVQRSIVEGRDIRQQGTLQKNGARSVDAVWDRVQQLSGNMLPGLRNYSASRPIAGGRYASLTSSNVHSRTRGQKFWRHPRKALLTNATLTNTHTQKKKQFTIFPRGSC